jgi:hypothetical protein
VARVFRKIQSVPGLSLEEKHLYARSLAATRRHPRPAMGHAPEVSPISRLAEAFRAEKMRFIVVGMTAAILQGSPATTLDVDLWIDLS